MNWWASLTRRDTAAADAQQMCRVQAGDSAAFALLVGRWQTPIRRLCVRMCGDEHLGEDLAQETFTRVFAKRHTFAKDRTFSTWLWRIAVNVCHEAARKKRIGLSDIEVSDWQTPHDRAVVSEEIARVRNALAQLDEESRTVVVLREYENLKFREIADVLGVPEGTAKWRMAEALKSLSVALREKPTRVTDR